MDGSFRHIRHKAPTQLVHPRGLMLVVPHVRSNVNLSRIVRAAGCCGMRELIVIGNAKVDRTIARDAADYVQLNSHRSLPPVISKYRKSGYRIVGLEQATSSQSLYEYRFEYETLLLLGHERLGLDDTILATVDDVVEIPVFGQPLSYNLATSAAMALYEYCRQHSG